MKHARYFFIALALVIVLAAPVILQTGGEPIERIQYSPQYLNYREITLVGSLFLSAAFISLGFFAWLSGNLATFGFYRLIRRYGKEEQRQDDRTLKVLETYHAQALKELRYSVALGNAIMLFGIGIIFLGIVLAFFGIVAMGIVSVASGIVIQIVNSLSGKERDKCRARVAKIEDDMMRLEIARSIEDPKSRDSAISKLIESYSKPAKQLTAKESNVAVPSRRGRRIDLSEEEL
jgi:hypothetical protein